MLITALLIALLVIAALSAVVLADRRRRESEASPSRSAPGTDLEPVDPWPLRVVHSASTDTRQVRLELWVGDGERALATIEELGVTPVQTITSPVVSMLLEPVLRAVPELHRASAEMPRLVVTFSRETTAALRTGSRTMMRLADGTLKAVARDGNTGRIAEIGSVALVGGALASSGLAMAAAGAAAAAVAQQRWLTNTLETIRRGTETLLLRELDDDYGAIHAAFEFSKHLDSCLDRAHVPELQRSEFAIVRRSVDAIYYSRRRFIERFVERLDTIHADSDEAWAREITSLMGKDPAYFEAEVMIYLQALVIRARLATSAAMLLALDGAIEFGYELLSSTANELRDDYTMLARKLRPLAEQTPRPWARQAALHESATRLHELMSARIVPQIPPRELEPARVCISSGPLGIEAAVAEIEV